MARRLDENHPELPIPLEFKESQGVKLETKAGWESHDVVLTPLRLLTANKRPAPSVFATCSKLWESHLLYPVPYSIRLEAWACEGTFDPRRLAEKMLKSFRDFPPPEPPG